MTVVVVVFRGEGACVGGAKRQIQREKVAGVDDTACRRKSRGKGQQAGWAGDEDDEQRIFIAGLARVSSDTRQSSPPGNTQTHEGNTQTRPHTTITEEINQYRGGGGVDERKQ